MGSFFDEAGASSARGTALASGEVSTDYSDRVTDPVDVRKAKWVEWRAALATPGAPTLTDLYWTFEWTDVSGTPSETDWVPLRVDSFETEGSPGVSTGYSYEYLDSGSLTVPGSSGLRTAARGLQMRAKLKAGTATNVLATIYATPRSE